MNKVVLGIVIVIALVVVGIFFYFSPMAMAPASIVGNQNNSQGISMPIVPENGEASVPDTTVSLEDDMIEAVLITYTAEGFEPKTVTVNKGQTVTFVNNSGRGMWVGADNHPTHTLYPEKSEGDCLGSSFDACRSYVPGDSWSFTFDVVGSWGYHNHVQAGHRGTVTVE